MEKETANTIIANCQILKDGTQKAEQTHIIYFKHPSIYISQKKYDHFLSGIMLNKFTEIAKKYDPNSTFIISAVKGEAELIIT